MSVSRDFRLEPRLIHVQLRNISYTHLNLIVQNYYYQNYFEDVMVAETLSKLLGSFHKSHEFY